jgi:hypothetical protein
LGCRKFLDKKASGYSEKCLFEKSRSVSLRSQEGQEKGTFKDQIGKRVFYIEKKIL